MRQIRRLTDALTGRVDLSAVAEKLASADPGERVAAIQVVLRAGFKQSVPLLLPLTESEQNPAVRHTLATGIMSRSWEPSTPDAQQLRLWAFKVASEPVSAVEAVAIAPPPPPPPAVPPSEPLAARRPAGLSGATRPLAQRSRPAAKSPAALVADGDPLAPWVVQNDDVLSALSAAIAGERRESVASYAQPRRAAVLVTGVGGPAGIAVASALLRADVDVVVADASDQAVGLRMFPSPCLLPPSTDPGFVDAVIKTCRTHRCDAVISTVAEELVQLSPRAADLAAASISYLASPPRALERCLDKWRFFKVLDKAGIATALTQRAAHFNPDTLPGPWVIKPRFGRGSRDIYFCDDADKVPVLASLVPDALIQSRLPGREFTADCLSDRDGHPLAIVPRWRLATRGGISSAAETFADDGLRVLCARLIAELSLVGPSCVQGFVADDGSVAFTEINPRFSGGLSCSLASGADLVGQYLAEMRGGPADLVALRYKPGVTTLRYFSDVDATAKLAVSRV